jgi:hypothetical protein
MATHEKLSDWCKKQSEVVLAVVRSRVRMLRSAVGPIHALEGSAPVRSELRFGRCPPSGSC